MKDQRTQCTFELGLVKEYKFTGKEGDKGIFHTEKIVRTKVQMHEKITLQYVQRMSRNPIWLKQTANRDVSSEIGWERKIQSNC